MVFIAQTAGRGKKAFDSRGEMKELVKKRKNWTFSLGSLHSCLITLGEDPEIAYNRCKYSKKLKRTVSSGSIYHRYGSLDAMEARVKHLYRERVKELHPDAGGEANSEALEMVQRARDTLLKVISKKRTYGAYKRYNMNRLMEVYCS